MKKLLIIVLIIIAGYFVWKTIQTKPDASVPQAAVSDTTAKEGTTTEKSPETTQVTPTTSNATTVDNSKVAVAFKGFGPGKVHDGTISDVKSNLTFKKDKTLSGNISVGMASLKTDMDPVTKHLKTDAFFDVKKYPTASFVITEDLTASTCTGDTVRCKAPYLYGKLTMHGMTKEISFPVTKTDTEFKADFTLNMKDFGIDQAFANAEIELIVIVPVK